MGRGAGMGHKSHRAAIAPRSTPGRGTGERAAARRDLQAASL